MKRRLLSITIILLSVLAISPIRSESKNYRIPESRPLGSAPRYLIIHCDLDNGLESARQIVQEIEDSIGIVQNGNLYLAMSVAFSMLNYSPESDEPVCLLKGLLALSEERNMPVHIHVDGQQWIGGCPDLWNWWDPSKPGYNPENRYNVEWTAWTPDSAVKICWRDWGRQLRVLPAPNILSPKILQAHYDGYAKLLPVLARWKDSLPQSKKYLFAGVRVGWEAGFNHNAYHYKGGNALFEKYPDDITHDPAGRLSIVNFAKNNNVEMLGYAAATVSGTKKEGQLTNSDYEYMTYKYLLALCKEVRKYGFSKEELFTHMGGNYEPFPEHLKFWPAMNPYATPGWSFYSINPHTAGTLGDEMAEQKRTSWAASEWLWPGQNAAEWADHINTTFSFMDCRMVIIYNWRGIRTNPEAVQAVRDVLSSDIYK